MLAQNRRQRQSHPPDLRQLSQLLDPVIAGRLHGAGITTVADWLRLTSRKRTMIFGVTRAMVSAVDAAIGKVRP
jgi:hypothetical protein